MHLSKILKQSMIPIMGVALITSTLVMNIGYKDALLIGIGMAMIVAGIIKAVCRNEEED